MFEFYYTYGLHPVKIDGKVYLEFDKNVATRTLIESLNDWNDEYEVFQTGRITKEQFIELDVEVP